MNMRNPAEQAAYEFGRAAAKYEMAIQSLGAAFAHGTEVVGNTVTGKVSVSGVASPPKRRGRVAKTAATAAPKEPKAPVISRGIKVKRASAGPRTKGVKEAIVNLIGQHSGITVANIVSQLGFKATSVKATLMGLKKSNIATQDDEKNWYLTSTSALDQVMSSNSEHQVEAERQTDADVY